MKKVLLALGVLLAPCLAQATWDEMWTDIPSSSYTDVATPGPILFSSQTIRFTGVSVASVAANSYIAIFRSTSPTFTADIATQTMIYTGYSANASAHFIPLFEMTNASYTYISKFGFGQVTLWFHCTDKRASAQVVCPGLKASGQR